MKTKRLYSLQKLDEVYCSSNLRICSVLQNKSSSPLITFCIVSLPVLTSFFYRTPKLSLKSLKRTSPLFSELGHFLSENCLTGLSDFRWVGVKFAIVVTDDLTKKISGVHSSEQKQAKRVAFWTPLINSDVLMSAVWTCVWRERHSWCGKSRWKSDTQVRKICSLNFTIIRGACCSGICVTASCGEDVSSIGRVCCCCHPFFYSFWTCCLFQFCKVDTLWFPSTPWADNPCWYLHICVFFTTFLQSTIFTYTSKTGKNMSLLESPILWEKRSEEEFFVQDSLP